MLPKGEKGKLIRLSQFLISFFSSIKDFLNRDFLLSHGSEEERAYFIENLATMLQAGIGITVALDAMRIEFRSRAMQRVCDSMKVDLENGLSLSAAFSRTHLFPSSLVALVRLGETSGRLVENLRVIAFEAEKTRRFRSKLRSAMIYPALVFFFTLLIGIGVAWFVLPRLSSVFRGMHVELPFITRALISTGEFVSLYGIVIIPVTILLLSIGLYFLFFNSRTKVVGQRFLFVFSSTRRVIQEVELARFGYSLSALLDVGLPILDAIESLRAGTSSPLYARFYSHLRSSLELGQSFEGSFRTYKNIYSLFPAPVAQMIFAAERSGMLSSTLNKIGEIFEIKSDLTTKNLAVLLEPLLLVVVWVGVVFVALAVIMPIYSLLGGLG